ncbi:MAG: spore protein [Symbiobacteriaceae bacterium]|jgi:spore maturation protein CgeB|nr:spore protein [Symbiobacteriaceae bacterium]
MNVLFLEVEPLYEDLLPTGLRQVGCSVRTLNEVLDGRLEQELASFRPDFMLTLGWSWFPTPERLEVIREASERHGIPVVAWMTEDPCWHEHYCVPYVQRLQPDLVLTICAEYVARYEAMGFRAACLPFGYNHDLYQPVAPKPEYACDIAIVANFYTAQYDEMNRKRSLEALVRPLLERGYNMKIWGNNWERAPEFGLPMLADGVRQGYLHHRETPAVYNAAKIVVGLQNEFEFETNLTMRTCEVMGAGGFLLTSRTRAVERFFKHGKHLVMSNSPAETLLLVDYYLRHPDERAQIASEGQAVVEAHHTYAHRALELLTVFARLREMNPLQAAVPAGQTEAAAGRAEAAAGRAEVAAGRAEAAAGQVEAVAGRVEAAAGRVEVVAAQVGRVDPAWQSAGAASDASGTGSRGVSWSGSVDSLAAVAGAHSHDHGHGKFPCHPYCCCCKCRKDHHHHHHHCDCSDSSSSSSTHCDCSDSSSSSSTHCDCSDSSSSSSTHCDCSDSSSSSSTHCDCSDSSSSGSTGAQKPKRRRWNRAMRRRRRAGVRASVRASGRAGGRVNSRVGRRGRRRQ